MNFYRTVLPDIRTLSLEDLNTLMQETGQPTYRAPQVLDWLWKKKARSFEEMSNLPKTLRQILQDRFAFYELTPETEVVSSDGTVKYTFRLPDGHLIESVLIPVFEKKIPKRMTACVSSQAGCGLGCKFCATGYLNLKRNLWTHEIIQQVEFVNSQAQARYGHHLTNIVYMGMGEPLLNYTHVWQSIATLTAPEGLNMSPRRITLSTSGIAKMIKKLADDNARFEFALSLHAPTDEKRSQIMPINDTNNLDALADALIYFHQKTKTRVTYEYILFRDFNDSPADARALAEFARIIPSKINIIQYNPIDQAGYQYTTPEREEAFCRILENKNLIVNVRRSRGKDISAACGQLANKTDIKSDTN